MTIREPNVPLLRKVWEHVKDEPEDYYQGSWIIQREPMCGTAYCFAGHALIMTGHTLEVASWSDRAYFLDGERVTGSSIEATACKELGISYTTGDRLFYGGNDVGKVGRIVGELIGEDLLL